MSKQALDENACLLILKIERIFNMSTHLLKGYHKKIFSSMIEM